MKTADKDKLEGLFNQIRMEEPSAEFTTKLMQRVYAESLVQKKKRKLQNSIYTALSIAGGIAALVVIPLLIFIYGNFELSNLEIQFPDMLAPILSIIQTLKVNPMISIIGFTVLFLLLADLFIRKFKSEHDNHLEVKF